MYVLHFIGGRIRHEGAGQSFIYFAPTSTIVDIPLSSIDVPFIFQELTANFQQITLQGQLTYRVHDPVKLAGILDFSVDARGCYLNENPPLDLILQRLNNAAQTHAMVITQKWTLRAALGASDAIATELLSRLHNDQTITMLGIEILALSLVAVKSSPETAKALEAEAREELLRQADQAIYDRRNAAVAEERTIKESELNTEVAVENKRREIREAKMRADIALEEQRASLIERTVENERKHADSRAYALRTTLEPLQDANWKTLMAVSAKNGDPATALSLAFEELASNATKIGTLNLTPDLIQSLANIRSK